jgi:hypothetical protein
MPALHLSIPKIQCVYIAPASACIIVQTDKITSAMMLQMLSTTSSVSSSLAYLIRAPLASLVQLDVCMPELFSSYTHGAPSLVPRVQWPSQFTMAGAELAIQEAQLLPKARHHMVPDRFERKRRI